LMPRPVYVLVLGKVLAQFVVCAIPLMLAAPLLGAQFGLPLAAPLVLMASLALGTPVILLIGSVGAALTLGLRSASTLTSLLVMPLYIPALIFGTGAVHAVIWGGTADAHMRLLAAMLILSFVVALPAASAALRISLE
jgi:heme exporter protein B